MEQHTAIQTTPGVWVFTWTPVPTSYYEIWQDGILLHTTNMGDGTYTTTAPDGPTDAPPLIEIHDTQNGKAQNEGYPPYSVLQWRGVPGATGYRVERLDGQWRAVAPITERGVGWYSYSTNTLVDDTDVQFRITALDARGVAGVALVFTVRIVCTPAPSPVALVATGGNIEVRAV